MEKATASYQQKDHPRPASILIVENGGSTTRHLQRMLDDLGYLTVDKACRSEEACQCIAQIRPDLVLIDLPVIEDDTGIDVATQIHLVFDIPVIFLTEYAPERVAEVIESVAPFACVPKPVEPRDLHMGIERTLHRHRLEMQLRDNERRL